MFVWAEIQSATLLHRAIVTLQLFEMTSRGFAVIYRFRHAGRSVDQGSEPNIGRNDNAPSRFAVGSIRFFVTFFFVVFFFDFMPMPILVLAFIARRQLLSRSEPNLSRRRVLALYRRVLCPLCVYR